MFKPALNLTIYTELGLLLLTRFSPHVILAYMNSLLRALKRSIVPITECLVSQS
jgi:hypothetical protein